MNAAAKIAVGALVVGVGAAGIAIAMSDDDAQPSNTPPAGEVRWTGSVGARAFEVQRQGVAQWAWRGDEVGSGAEDSADKALRTVLRELVETATPADFVTIVATVGGGEVVRGAVVPALMGGWLWTAKPSSGDEARGDAPSRGQAVLELLEWIDDHGGGGRVDGASGPGEDDDDDEGGGEGEGEDEVPEVDPDGDTVPIDVPPNLHELNDVAELETWAVAHALDPDGSQGPQSSFFVLAYDRGWIGRAQTLDEVRTLAKGYPDVHFVLTSFELTRAAFGEPRTPIGYVATAVGPDRRARAEQVAGRKKTLGPISPGRLVQLVRYAEHGPAANDAVIWDGQGPDHLRYVLMVRHVPGTAAWEWLAWRGELGEDDEAVHRQGAPNPEVARTSASEWLAARPAAPPLGMSA